MNLSFHPVYLIAVALVVLAVYFGRHQVRTLRSLKSEENLPREDRRYLRSQASLRLVSCGLLVVLAGLIAGAYLLGLEGRTDELIRAREAANAQGKQPPATPEQRRFINQYTGYWMVTSLVLLAVVCLAVVDLWGIRRFGLRHYRKIQADRRAMIERQVAIFRSQRNGHG